MPKLDFTPDINLQLKDAGLIAASAAAQVGGADRIIDLGDGGGAIDFDVFFNVTAVEIASNDELYRLQVQGSSSATFASGIVALAEIELGALEVTQSDADEDVAGIYRLRCSNNKGATNYRYIRVYSLIAGAIATGINYSAWMSYPA